MQGTEPDTVAPEASPSTPAREDRKTAFVLLACVMVAIAMIGLLLDSFTDSIRKLKPGPVVATAVPVPGARDDFARADNAASLGKAKSGQLWRAGAGRWGISAKRAVVVVPATGPSLATVPVGASDGRVEVGFGRVAEGIGFAFRCRNALNCWRVEAVPQFGTWNVLKSVRGKETRVANLGTVPVSDGTRVAVEMAGSDLTFFVNGKKTRAIDDGAFVFETRAGLSLRESASAGVAQWTSFAMLPRVGAGALNVREATIRDKFKRTRATDLGTMPTGQTWDSVSGGWSTADGLAGSTTPATDRTSLALVDLGSADGVVQATVLAPQNESGLAFRCRDVANCWRLEAVLGFGTWNIYRVENGEVSTVGNLGIASTAPGTTVSVEMRGSQLTFFVNGVKQRTITDAALSSERGAGLVVEPGQFSSSTRWSEFAAKPEKRL